MSGSAEQSGESAERAGDSSDRQGEASQFRPSALLATVRENSGYHWAALVVACVIGLVLATFHWSGIVIGGALVGILAADIKRAVLSGLGFGILVVLVWAVLIQLSGSLQQVSAMNEIALLPVGIGLGLAVLGSLLRGALS